MRTTLVSVLAVLAQWGIPANAQPQAGTLPASSAVPNGYWAHPSTKRLFFLCRTPRTSARPPVFGQPAHAPGMGGLFSPFSITAPIPQNPPHPTLKFTLDGPPTAGKPASAGFPEIPQAQEFRAVFLQQAVIGTSQGCGLRARGNAGTTERYVDAANWTLGGVIFH